MISTSSGSKIKSFLAIWFLALDIYLLIIIDEWYELNLFLSIILFRYGLLYIGWTFCAIFIDYDVDNRLFENRISIIDY